MEKVDLALLVSFVSLVISAVTLMRDHYKIHAYSFASISYPHGSSLRVTVANHGRRPVSITHVVLVEKNGYEHRIQLPKSEENRIDSFQSAEFIVQPSSGGPTWNTVFELEEFQIHVVDALGKRYPAKFYATHKKT